MREQIIEILTEICPGVDFEQETSLIDDGLIDSLDIVAVVTVDAICQLIERAQG